MDQSLLLLPYRNGGRRLCWGFDVPGLGVAPHRGVIVLRHRPSSPRMCSDSGSCEAWESILGRIPFVKSIYNSVKQVSDTLFSSSGQAFRKALVLIEWPRPGVWTVAFLTGTPGGDVVSRHLRRRLRECLRADDTESRPAGTS